MLHGRILAIAAIVGILIIGSVINAAGPFGAHPTLAYSQFLADFETGHVEQIVRWRDRLEVAKASELFLVTVPDGADVALDLGQARVRGGVGIAFQTISDGWLVRDTPLVPMLLVGAGLFLWFPAARRGRPDLLAGSTRASLT
jgi:hypothetical protein